MAPMERFIFWAISRGFIPEVTSLRSILSCVSVQRRPAGRGPVNGRGDGWPRHGTIRSTAAPIGEAATPRASRFKSVGDGFERTAVLQGKACQDRRIGREHIEQGIAAIVVE